ncbi:protein kinase [Nocardia sp. NPDC059240]|uniref:protein kinase domain-containing protein n=1 Tax=Nocardia sp. NPDC059240 TaxID=3346786 RepID=UPI00368A4AD4
MELRAGTDFAGYVVERRLGAGGMGVVYLARYPRLERLVALKVLGDVFAADPGARAAFEREARLAARLEHPNIVAVYDRSGPGDPALWLSMRYLAGGDAMSLLASNPRGLDPQRAIRLIADAADALDHAHAQGVLHRDVKPANLLIDHDRRHGERAVLTDFGIARTLDDTVTLSGIAASFAYAAPERFTNQPADHRSDIYSLGCTLYQLLTAKPPYPRKDQAAVIGAHLMEPPPSPRAVWPELPAALDAVIATAMAKQPGDRYPSCSALADAALAACTLRVSFARPANAPAAEQPSRTGETVPEGGASIEVDALIRQPDHRTTPSPPAKYLGPEGVAPAPHTDGPHGAAATSTPLLRRWRRHPWRIIVGVLTIVAAAAGIVAIVLNRFADDSPAAFVNRSSVERAVMSAYADLQSADCPDRLSSAVGASVRCTAVKQDSSRMYVMVTVTGSQGRDVNIAVDTSPN